MVQKGVTTEGINNTTEYAAKHSQATAWHPKHLALLIIAFAWVANFLLIRQFGFYELLLYGIIIVLIIRFMPEGLIKIPRVFASWFVSSKWEAEKAK